MIQARPCPPKIERPHPKNFCDHARNPIDTTGRLFYIAAGVPGTRAADHR